MKKRYLPFVLCISLTLSIFGSVISYAHTSANNLEPIWIESFDDSSKYTSTDKYTASVSNGVLTLQATNDTHRDTYQLSGEQDGLSGKTQLTFAVNFKLDSLHTSGSIFASYGHSENKAYIAGFQRLNGYSYLVHGKAEEASSRGTLTTTQRFIKADNSSSAQNVPFPATDVCTMIIEVDGNSSSVCTMYVNGVKTGIAGDFRGANYKNYDASTDTEKTMNGHFGMLVPTDDTVIKIGTYAVYDGIGLDHNAIKQCVYNAQDFGVPDGELTTPDNDDQASLDPIWIERFDASATYSDTDKYKASVSKGALTLQATDDNHRTAYTLSGSDDALNGKTKLTFAVNFTIKTLHTSGGIFVSYGHSDGKAYIAGFQRLNGYAYLVHGKATESTAKGKLTTTQRLIVTPFTDGTPSSNKVEFPESDICTMIIEVNDNTSSVCTMYVNGIKAGVAGTLREGADYQKYDAVTDTAKTMNGHFGILVPTDDTVINIGTYAIYNGIGLDHSAIMQQVYDTEDFSIENSGSTVTPPQNNSGLTNMPVSDDANEESTDTQTFDESSQSENEEDKGCSSTVSASILVVIGVAGAVALKKKKE